MAQDINKEIERLCMLKAEIDEINLLKEIDPSLQVVSQLMYDFLKEKGLLKSGVYYRITSLELKPYIDDFRG